VLYQKVQKAEKNRRGIKKRAKVKKMFMTISGEIKISIVNIWEAEKSMMGM
jgi:hypothetical protein